MRIEQTSVEALVPYAMNSRTHSDAQVAQIAASIKEFGWTNPVLIDEEGGIIAGHGRVMAARKLGLTEVPAIRLSHLTDIQKRAYVIADNKLALNAGWDEEVLKLELHALSGADYNLELTGFLGDELTKAMYSEELAEPDDDEASGNYAEQYGVIVMCNDEQEQEAVYNRLTSMGMPCKVVCT